MLHLFSRFGSYAKPQSSKWKKPNGSQSRRPLFELLEDRRVLAIGAIGTFIRTDGQVATTANVFTDGNNVPSGIVSGFGNGNDSSVHEVVTKSTKISQTIISGVTATAVGQSTALSPTYIGDPTFVPNASTASAGIAVTSVQLPDGIDGNGIGGATAATNALFDFQDADDGIEPQWFHGHLFIAAASIYTEHGAGGARTTFNASATISVGNYVATVRGSHDNHDGLGGLHWHLTVNVPGYDLIEHARIEGADGFNLFFHFVVPIADGDDVLIQTTSGGQGITFADAEGAGSANSIQASAAWGFVTGEPERPDDGDFDLDGDVDGNDFDVIVGGFPIEFGQDPITAPPNYFDGDVDHDGDVDEDDFEVWVANADDNLFLVTNDEDEDDNDYSFGDLSLREALELADAQAGTDTILFAPWINEIELYGSPLEIDSGNDVFIKGPGADELTIDANNLSRVFFVDPSVDATISGMTLTKGNQVGGGGAIYNRGNLTLDSVVVVNNRTNSAGGGVYVDNGTLNVRFSTLDDNHAIGAFHPRGGAIAGVFPAGASLIVESSTISNNTAVPSSGGISYGGGVSIKTNAGATASITNSTISGNTSGYGSGITVDDATPTVNLFNSTITKNIATASTGGGFHKGHGAATVRADNTIIAQNTSSDTTKYDVAGSLASGSSNNIIGQVGGSGLIHNVNGNKVGAQSELIDPLLAPLGDYGGKTKTHALKLNSPALNAGNNAVAPAFDQRGEDRPTSAGGGIVDIGAFEAGDFTVLTVRTDTDRLNATLNADDLSLREALALAKTLAGTDNIAFDESLFDQGPATIALTYDGSADPDLAADSLLVDSSLNILGPGADLLTIYGNGLNSVIRHFGTATIEGLTVMHGGGEAGGGIYSDGLLTLREARIVENTAVSAGGGVYSSGYGSGLKIISSEISQNTLTGVNGNGGGVYSSRYYSGGALEILNSTLSGNSANTGGGLYVQTYGATFVSTVVNSTITANTAATGGGIYSTELYNSAGAALTLHNTIVADNRNFSSALNEIAGANLATASSYNLLRSGQSGGLSGNNVLLSGSESARLKALGYYGGRARTHVPFSDSRAIDNGNNSVALSMGLVEDQRGLDRFEDHPYDSDSVEEIDIGAVELAFEEAYS